MLPEMGIRYYVSSIRRKLRLFANTLNTYYFRRSRKLCLIPTTQKGFAPIPLVVLLLFGIAAGVILVQNGINFLPKAEAPSDRYFQCSPEEVGTGPSYSCQKMAFSHCDISQNGKILFSPNDLTTCKQIDNTYYQSSFYCYWDPPTCTNQQPVQPNNTPSDFRLKPHEDANLIEIKKHDPANGCAYPDIDLAFVKLSPGEEYTETCNDIIKVRSDSSIRFYCDNNSVLHSVKYRDSACATCTLPDGRTANFRDEVQYCKGENLVQAECGGRTNFYNETTLQSNSQRCQSNPISANSGGCSAAEIAQCKADNPKFDRCYKNTSGERRCLYAQNAACDVRCSGNMKCEIVRGEQRCIYPDNVSTCIQGDGNPSTCKVIVRDGKRISSEIEGCNEGWKNFCKIVAGKGCKNMPDGVPDCDGEPNTITGTAVGAPTRPPTTAAAPGTTGTNTVTSTSTGPGGARPPTGQTSPPHTAAAPVTTQPPAQRTCGVDANGLNIPCYAIGVFTPEDLAATEADAKIALTRYDQFNQILSDVKGKISSEIEARAREKLELAKARANACITK